MGEKSTIKKRSELRAVTFICCVTEYNSTHEARTLQKKQLASLQNDFLKLVRLLIILKGKHTEHEESTSAALYRNDFT